MNIYITFEKKGNTMNVNITFGKEVGELELGFDNLLVEQGGGFGLEGQEAAHHGKQNHSHTPHIGWSTNSVLALNLLLGKESCRQDRHLHEQNKY